MWFQITISISEFKFDMESEKTPEIYRSNNYPQKVISNRLKSKYFKSMSPCQVYVKIPWTGFYHKNVGKHLIGCNAIF